MFASQLFYQPWGGERGGEGGVIVLGGIRIGPDNRFGAGVDQRKVKLFNDLTRNCEILLIIVYIAKKKQKTMRTEEPN